MAGKIFIDSNAFKADSYYLRDLKALPFIFNQAPFLGPRLFDPLSFCF